MGAAVIAPGAICICPRASGAQLWVVLDEADDNGRWRLRHRDRADLAVDEDDLILVRPAETYAPASMIVFRGIYHEVGRDLGEAVELIAPIPLRVSKAELALALFPADEEEE